MITSITNDRVKWVRSLQSGRRVRHESARFIIEGSRLIQEALKTGAQLDALFYTEGFSSGSEGRRILHMLAAANVEPTMVSEAVMQRMTDTVTPQGILAVAAFPAPPRQPRETFALIIDGLHDPGNLGTIMRVATAAAVPVMYVAPDTVDPYSPKVVRGAMGAHFRLPVVLVGWDEIAVQVKAMSVYLADMGGEMLYFNADWVSPCALIVSDEARGPSNEARRLAQQVVTIPMPGGTESLNAAMAASIMIYEMLHQRIAAGGMIEPR